MNKSSTLRIQQRAKSAQHLKHGSQFLGRARSPAEQVGALGGKLVKHLAVDQLEHLLLREEAHRFAFFRLAQHPIVYFKVVPVIENEGMKDEA